MKRCDWVNPDNELYVKYHDEEWGVPLHDDNELFGMIILEGAQAGLSWETILKRRENYRKIFKNFDPKKVAKFTEKDVQRLLKDEGIIRNQLKIRSAINNAKCFLVIQKEFGSFDKYIWGFVDNKPIKNHLKKISDYPTETELSREISKDLKKRGFNFVGPTIMYAYMQSIGMVNDHMSGCEFR